jgi:hypothetical protein
MTPSRRLIDLITRVFAAACAIAIVAVALSATGAASAARRAVTGLVDGHPVVTKPRPGGVLVLGKNGRFPASAIPSVRHAATAGTAASAKTAATAKTALTAKTASTANSARQIAGQTLAQVTGSCPDATADIGTWCLMMNPYPIASAQQGLNDYFWAAQACADIGGFLPDAAQLIGAAGDVKLESTIDDNPATATVQGSDGNGPELDQREMSATLVTTQAGADAAGSEGVTPGAHPDPTSGQPDPTPQPAVPSPPTLQYVTVYDNHNNGGFAGAEPVGTPENFRCGFYLKQTVKTTTSPSGVRAADRRADVLARSVSVARRVAAARRASAGGAGR